MAAGISIIGSIGVRVSPDLTGFKQKLRVKLKEIEKTFGDLKLEVDLDLDAKGLNKKVEAAVANAQRAAGDVTVPLDFDMDKSVRDTLAEIDGVMDRARRKLRLELGWDKERAERELRHFRDKWDGDPIEFQATVDSLLARAELARVARDRIVMLHVQVSKKSLAAATTAIAALSGARMAVNVLQRLWDRLKEIDKSLPAITAVITGIQLLSAWLTAALSNTLALTASLMEIAALALVLPGVAAGFAVGIGASLAVFKDFNTVIPELKTRLSQLQDQMSARFWAKAEAPIRRFVDHLFPEFSAGMLVVSDHLGDFYSRLADALRTNLGGRLGGMFENLAESIDIASGASDALANIIGVLGTKGSEWLPRLAEWFKRNTIAFDEWITNAADSGEFDRWIERAIENAGHLKDALFDFGAIIYTLGKNAEEAGGSGLEQFAETMRRVRDVVESPAFLERYRRFVRISHDFLSIIAGGVGDSFSTFVKSFVDDLMYAMESMGPALGQFWGAVFDGLSSAPFKEGLRDLFDGIADGLRGLTPYVEPIAGGFGALLSILGEMARQFLPTLGAVLAWVAEVLQEHGPKIEEVIKTLSQALRDFIDEYGDDIKEAFGAVLDFALRLAPYAPYILIAAGGFRLLAGALKLFKPLLPAIRGLGGLSRLKWTGVAGLGRTLTSGRFIRGAGLLGVIVGALFGAWQNSEKLRESFWPLAEAVHNLSKEWGNLLDWMSRPFFIVLGDSLGVWAEKFTHFTEGLADLMAGDFSGAMEHWAEIADFSFVGELWDKWGDEAEKWWEEKFPRTTGSKISDEIEKTSRKGIAGFRKGIDEGVPQATRDMEQQLRRGLGSLDLSGSGRGIAETARRGLSSVSMEPTGRSLGTSFVRGFSAVSGASSGKGLAAEVRRGLASVDAVAQGKAMANGFVRGINSVDGWPAGKGLANEALRGLTGDTYTKGRSFADDFARGIRATKSISNVKEATKTIAQVARGGLPGSPAEYGPLSGSGWSRYAGQHYSEDFAQGILERRNDVMNATESIASTAANSIDGLSAKGFQSAFDVNNRQELVLANMPVTLLVDGQPMRALITQQVGTHNQGEALMIRYGRE